jgi:hypothetical protein
MEPFSVKMEHFSLKMEHLSVKMGPFADGTLPGEDVVK